MNKQKIGFFKLFSAFISLDFVLVLPLLRRRVLGSAAPRRRQPAGEDQAMTVKGGTSQACASCKFQRRKCTPECSLAPYFPPNDPKRFENAHKLFGVSNISKILNKIHVADRKEAMRSIIYEANARDKYPVHGCVGIIVALQEHIQQAQQELELLTAYLAMYRQQHHHHEINKGHSVPNTLALFQTQHDESVEDFGNNNMMNLGWDSRVQMGNVSLHGGEYDMVSPYIENVADHDKQRFIDSKIEAYEPRFHFSFRCMYDQYLIGIHFILSKKLVFSLVSS